MIIVTGATGALNGATVGHLLERVPASEIAVVARDVDKAARFADLGIEVRYGDYADPTSLPAAFDGADQLLLVSSSDPTADAVGLHQAAVGAAADVGVGRILYTSHQAAAPTNPFHPAQDHFATEQALAESGIPWTSLRNGFYAHSLQWLAGPWRESGVIAVPADGPVSWTAREDASEAAAIILTSPHAYDGPITLTAPAAPTFAELAHVASEVSGRAIAFDEVGEAAWTAARAASGQPETMTGFVLGFYRAARDGFFATTDPLLGQLLNREPRSARDAMG